MPNVGNLLGGAAGRYGMPAPQHTQPVTNLSAHVDGGTAPGVSGANANRTASTDQRTVLYTSVGIIAAALLILWLMGAFAFRGALL